MWLINANTLELELFTNVEAQSYAILSHTWEDDEVTWDDFQDLEHASMKKGFAKIKATCELAQQRDLGYAWVDTCCINKASSAELSEAINSMFNWYRDAAVCFAFLADLAPNTSFDDVFPRCRWLTRGWTLQELIAPKEVEFYDAAWNRVSSKIERRQLIAQATGIDSFVLQDSSMLSSVLVARRMSWAASRQTTRVEDMAYCLLGIMDINMPMLYGEGARAFVRLQEEVAKATIDLSLFAWRSGPQDPSDAAPSSARGQEFRGIFAHSPREFARCANFDSGRRGNFHDSEFAITNKGMRIETTLVELFSESEDVIFNVAVSEGHSADPTDSNGWLGIYLRKTPRGYVRASPDRLYTAGEERVGRRRVPKAVVYIRKDITPLESMRIQMQYRGAVVLESLPDFVKIVSVEPHDLYDHRRGLFLHYGIGLNVYLHLRVGIRGKFEPEFDVLVAASTMWGGGTGPPSVAAADSRDGNIGGDAEMTGVPGATTSTAASTAYRRGFCFVWHEQSVGYRRVTSFTRSAQEVADYTAADYLRRFVPDGSLGLTAASCVYMDRSARQSAIVNVTLEEGVYERWKVYRLKIGLGHGQYPQFNV